MEIKTDTTVYIWQSGHFDYNFPSMTIDWKQKQVHFQLRISMMAYYDTSTQCLSSCIEQK